MRSIFLAFKKVFGRKRYIALFFILFSISILFSIWLPNLSFIKNLIFSENISIWQKVRLLISSLGAFKTNFTFLAKITTLITSFLFSLNFTFLLFCFFKYLSIAKSLKKSLLGFLFGILGVGCTSCGSFILASFLGISGSVVFLSYFPLKGQEFALIGSIVFLISIYFLAREIVRDDKCNVF